MRDLGRTLIAAAERGPGAEAIVDGALRLNYADWLDRVRRLAGGLDRAGLGRGDHLASVLQNRWQAAALHWACQWLGVISTPLNWRLTPAELDYCLTDSKARAVVFESASAAAVAGAPRAAVLPRISIDGAPGASGAFGALLDGPAATDQPRATPEDVSIMLYTSGTTGRPKGVPRRHRAERAATLAHVAQNGYQRGERCLGVMPLYHTMGVRALLAMALVDGCFVCQPRFDASESLKLIAAERLTCLYLVPTLYHDLLGQSGFDPSAVATVRRLGFAGAPMTEGLLQDVTAAFRPERLVNHYGSSEIYTFTVEPEAARKPGSAGKAGLNQRIRVVPLGTRDPDRRAAPGENGEIIADLASDEAFEGYWNRPDADSRAIVGDWYFTGDTGFFDADGDLYVTGRVDDMIITGGENVAPVEVESVLSLHPLVGEVAVAGVADERWGQRVTAFVCRAAPVTAEELDAHCRNSDLAAFKRPRAYVFAARLPKSPTGKVLRRELVAGTYDLEEDC
ncbi:MAG: AMP-binding protein [Alphaproteobacteria bacterium]|jgi:2-furoate---CoA ligase|nr:AMP-binding protein [Alphaproteobacteria bacterium]MDP6516059.1 AMP-binding protein [Alphaproteobacteria bacterium]